MLDGKGRIAFPYEGGKKPIVTPPHTGTYADPTVNIRGKEYWWNHGLAKIMTALIQAGLSVEQFNEYPYSPYDAGSMRQRKDGNWVWKNLGEKVPVLFSIKAGRRRPTTGSMRRGDPRA
jgi:hypothetical protein